MDKRRFYYNVEVGRDGRQEFDFLSTSINKIHDYIKRPVSRTTIENRHIGNLDLLAYEQYEDEFWWWVISLVNGIIDPFDSDLVGQIVIVPDLADVFDFWRENFNPVE